MMKTKEYEINLVKERNERLRHIQREKTVLEKLNDSPVEHYKEISDPQYMHDENPNSIIKASKLCHKCIRAMIFLSSPILSVD